jgi:hypothetical protein
MNRQATVDDCIKIQVLGLLKTWVVFFLQKLVDLFSSKPVGFFFKNRLRFFSSKTGRVFHRAQICDPQRFFRDMKNHSRISEPQKPSRVFHVPEELLRVAYLCR